MKTFIIGISLCLLAFNTLAEDEDWQVWTESSLKGRLDDRLTWALKTEKKFVNDANDLNMVNMDFGLAVKPRPWLSLGVNYRKEFARSEGQWLEENRPHLNVSFHYKWKGISIQDRNRVEFRFREAKDDLTRYRNKLTLKLPISYTPLNLQPYIADEIFMDHGDLNRNRFYLGFKGNWKDKIYPEIYYLQQCDDKSDGWIDKNVVGFRVGCRH